MPDLSGLSIPGLEGASAVGLAVFVLLFFLSVWSVGVSIERLIVFARARRQSIAFARVLAKQRRPDWLDEAVETAGKYPHSHLARVEEELANVDNKLATTDARIATLHLEPALRSLTPGALNAERDAWQTDRTHQQETARREAQQLWLRQQEPRNIEPWSPTPSAPDRGYGIGR